MEIFIAAIVSVIVQLVKKYLGTSNTWTMATLLAISLLAGWGVWALQNTGYWESVVQVGILSAGFWALVIRRIDA